MGRLILIEFDDDKAALKLKKQIDQATRSGKFFRVVGYFAQPPGPYCQCPVETWTNERGRPFTPDKFNRKTGWRKCLGCQLYRDEPGYLTNMLKPEKVIKPRLVQMNTKLKNLMGYYGHISGRTQVTQENE